LIQINYVRYRTLTLPLPPKVRSLYREIENRSVSVVDETDADTDFIVLTH